MTLSKAATLAKAGDQVFIGAGTYRETLKPANAGTAANPIIFKALDKGEVIISATEEVKNWTLHSGSIYKASTTLDLGLKNNVYFNGQLVDLARWPNNTDQNKYTVDATPITAGSASHIEAPQILALMKAEIYLGLLE